MSPSTKQCRRFVVCQALGVVSVWGDEGTGVIREGMRLRVREEFAQQGGVIKSSGWSRSGLEGG